MRPARLFLIVACLVELALIGPNIQAELEIGTGVHVLVVRSVLTVARLSPFLAGFLSRATGRFGQRLQAQFELCSAAACGTTCTSAEPSRGIATALAGWYLIVTPVHDMLGEDTTDEKLVVTVTRNENPEPVVPFAVIMVANVVLFLCDALMLPLAPLMRRAEEPVPEPEPVRAETFTYGEDDEEAHQHQPKFPPTCVVCLADFVAGETVAQLPCGHVFHNQCISEWLNQHNTCPMRCEGRVLPPITTGAGDESRSAADHERESSSGEDHTSESEEGVSSSSSGRVVRATDASPRMLREIRV